MMPGPSQLVAGGADGFRAAAQKRNNLHNRVSYHAFGGKLLNLNRASRVLLILVGLLRGKDTLGSANRLKAAIVAENFLVPT